MSQRIPRPVASWLHYWAALTALATFVLLALGQLVTSFQGGMADPIWPTEPWYLFAIGWQEPSRGYLIEHTHRIAAFSVGGLVSVLALGLWWTDPNSRTRWAGLAAIVILLGGFGQFHGGLIAQRNLTPSEVRLPIGGTVVTLIGLTGILGLALLGAMRQTRLSGLRLLGVIALAGVMIQGLIGGFRVMLDALVGTDLATVHGIFAQVVFCVLAAIAVATGRPPTASLERTRFLARLSAVLVAFLFAQIVLGAFVRHSPTPLTQRLHFLNAFAATAMAVGLVVAMYGRPAAWLRAGLWVPLLALLLAAQLALGVEAWMAKFGSYQLPDLVKITTWYASIRTAHALVGSGLLAASLVIALRLRMPSPQVVRRQVEGEAGWIEPVIPAPHGEPIGSRFRSEFT